MQHNHVEEMMTNVVGAIQVAQHAILLIHVLHALHHKF